MAQNPTVLAIQAKIDGLQGLNQLKSALRGIGTQAKSADNDITGLADEIIKFAKETGNSINSLEAQKRAFDALKRSVEINSAEFKRAQQEIKRIDQALDEARGTVVSYSKNSISALRAQKQELLAVRDAADLMSKEFKDASIELSKLDKKLAKAEGRRGAGGRFGAAAQVAGTVAGAGVFGGPEGAIGAALGAFAGPQGAIVGGAIGAQVGQLRQALGATAEYAAELRKLRIALLGVTTSQKEYQQSLDFITKATKTFAIPQDVLTRQFTRLQASVQGAGGNIEDTKTAFNGIVAAVRATGGSLSDVDSALTATAQVFSKGKVSAEELRQQIGERLPGAFTLFAESIGKTPQELDKALELGEVGLQDFQTFAESIFERYGETAETIAKAPESAGDRLKVSLQELSEEIGTLLAPIGSEFQKVFGQIADSITKAARVLNNFFGLGPEASVKKNTILIQSLNKAIRETKKRIKDVKDETGVGQVFRNQTVKELERNIEEFEEKRERLRSEINRATRSQIPDISQPTAGGGLPGAGDDDETTTQRPRTRRGPDPMVALRRQASQEFRGLETVFAETARLRLKQKEAEFVKQISIAEKERNQQLVLSLTQEADRAKILLNIEALENQIIKRQELIASTRAKGIDVFAQEQKLIKDKNNLLIAETELEALLVAQDKDRLLFNQEITEEIDRQKKSLESQLTDRKIQLGLISKEESKDILIERERLRIEDQFPDAPEEQKAEALALFEREIDPTPFDIVSKKLSDLKEELEGLTNIGNVIANSASGIGDAFSQSFTDIITGSKSTKEALSDFFKSVGSFFLDLAKQVISKLIQIAILNAVTGLLPGLSGGGGFNVNTTSLGSGGGVVGGIGTLGPNFGIAQFEKGGRPPVNRPSIVGEAGPELFVPDVAGTIIDNQSSKKIIEKANVIQEISKNQFADGGRPPLSQVSLVGERGPELFIPDSPSSVFSNESFVPFQRDAIESSEESQGQSMASRSTVSERSSSNRLERSSSSRFRETREVMVPFTRSAEQISAASAERETAQAISNPGPLDVRFESQVINNVEYVTADQYRKGMSQAAERGRALTLEALQNSVKARKRIGL